VFMIFGSNDILAKTTNDNGKIANGSAGNEITKNSATSIFYI
jgi:hypothetical protein